jgi:hypothetical protein
LSSASSRAWTLASTRSSWFSSHMSCGVNIFSKESAIALALSTGWNLSTEAPWMAVGALGPSLFVTDFPMGHIACGFSSVFANRVSHHSSAFFRVVVWLISVVYSHWIANVLARTVLLCHTIALPQGIWSTFVSIMRVAVKDFTRSLEIWAPAEREWPVLIFFLQLTSLGSKTPFRVDCGCRAI